MEVAEMILSQARANAEAFRSGVRAGKELERQKMRPILSAYERAQQDPNARIPTYLQAAIYAVQEEFANEYADVMGKVDQLAEPALDAPGQTSTDARHLRVGR